MSAVKRFVKVFLVLMLILALLSGIVFGTTLFKYMKDVSDMELGDMSLNLTTSMYYYDENGHAKEAQKLYGKENRMWVNLDKIPDNLKNAFIAIEDERYYKHHGVDFRRTIKATLTYLIKDKSSFGGSTITQQLVKNLTGEDTVSPARKVKEMARAFKIDKELGKDKVLEMYLNVIYLANSCNGVQAASHKYFATDVSGLDLAQCAAIAGITKNPSKYNPIKNPDNLKTRQETVLAKMLELGMISQAEYDEAKSEPLNIQSDDVSVNENVNSYFVDHVINEVVSDLVERKGYSQKAATNLVYMGGLKIYMTMDPQVQNAVETVYEDESYFPKRAPKNPTVKDKAEYPQSAMCIIDPYTGQLKGLAGGIGKKTQNRVLNRATQSMRQPGSSIKPLSVYAPAVEMGLITPNSKVKDEAIDLDGWKPKNYYSGYKGTMTVRRAVELSANIPAVKILQDVGLDYSYDFLTEKLGMTTLVDNKEINGKIYSDKKYPALALGGLTQGVTPEEMAAAYGAFVNKGNYCKPYSYFKVVDSNGNIVLENESSSERAMSEKTASTMNSLLRSVVTSGTGVKAQLSNKMITCGKTGTTNSDKDRWFVGYTPYYVGSVWYGYDQPSSVSFLSSNPCISVWKAVMDRIHEGLEGKTLDGAQSGKISSGSSDEGPIEEQPTNQTKTVRICTESGLLATDRCPETKRETFDEGEAPTEYCHLKHSGETNEGTVPGDENSSTTGGNTSGGEPNQGGDTPAENTPSTTPETPSSTPSEPQTQPPSDGTTTP